MHRETQVANYILGALSSISLILMSRPLSAPVEALKASLSYAINPAAYYGSNAVERLYNVPVNIRHLITADVRNQALEDEMKRWALTQTEAEFLRNENLKLREALGLKAPQGRAALWAHVMERDPAHWYHSIMVDAGADQGVEINAPVLGPRGEKLIALGRITEVGPTSSKVLLITDELSSVAAYLSSATLEGLIQGQGAGHLLMNYLQSEGVLFERDTVLTSPTSATFPPDVLIGSVVKIYPRDPFLTFQSVEVKPAAEASAFRKVMILKAAVAAKPGPP